MNNDTSNRKIIISFLIVGFFLLILGAVSIFKMVELSNLTHKFHEHPFHVTTSTYKIDTRIVSIHRYMKDIVLSKSEDELQIALKKVNNDEKDILEEFNTVFKQYLGDKQEVQEFYDLFIGWRAIREDVIELMRTNRIDEAIKMNQIRAYNHVNELHKSVNKLVAFAHNKAIVFVKNADETKDLSVKIIIFISTIILVLMTIIVIVLIKNLAIIEKEKHENEVNMLEQSRLAQMGGMISMIAHQWRQPLSTISALAGTVQVYLELKKFDLSTKDGIEKHNQLIVEKLQVIDDTVQNLSETIDDFRNFYKPNKKATSIRLEDVILKSLNIIKTSLLNHDVKIIEQYNSKEDLFLYENEIMQVILNILKNSQDNFIEKNIENPYIKITTNKNSVSICDNGGGIKEDILPNIFDPYFSTKDEKNGTGLGLHMSKTIIEEHHNGSLIAKNIDGGICFVIVIDRLDGK